MTHDRFGSAERVRIVAGADEVEIWADGVDPVTGVAISWRSDLSTWAALEGLAEIMHHAHQVEAMKAAWVAAARDAGCSWAAIAEVLDVTKQGAMKRYRGLVT